MKFQVINPFSITRAGRRVEYRKGQRISETAYRRLNTRQQSRFLPARKCGAQSWTRAEYIAVAEAYLKHSENNYEQCIKDFRKVSDRHSDDAVKLATFSCAHLDTMSTAEGLKDHASELLEVLDIMDPGRFTATGKVENIDLALDSLLADIRG